MPEIGGVPEDPGQLPQPDKLTKAYFEVCSLLVLFSLNKLCTMVKDRTPGWHRAGGVGEGRGLFVAVPVKWSCRSLMAPNVRLPMFVAG